MQPTLKQLGADALGPHMGAERFALVTASLQHHTRPEVPDDREVLGPTLVWDRPGEDRPEERVLSNFGVEGIDDRPNRSPSRSISRLSAS
jgi:hypothetical protein